MTTTETEKAVFKVHIEGSIEAVWREITKTDELQQCFFNMRMHVDKFEPGGQLRMRSGNGKYTGVVGEILEFDPPHRSFQWGTEGVRAQGFKLRAAAALEGQTASGRMSIYLGALLVAEIALSIEVSGDAPSPEELKPDTGITASPVRRLYVAHAAVERQLALQYAWYAGVIDDPYLNQVVEATKSKVWSDERKAG